MIRPATHQSVTTEPRATPSPALRVLHIVHSLARAGVEQLVCELALANRNRMLTAVVCLDETGPLADELRRGGVVIYQTTRRKGLDLSQVARITQALRSFQPQVVHCHQYTPFFYGRWASLWAGTSGVLFTEHGRHFPDRVGWKRRAFNRILIGRGSRITAVCKFTRQRLIEKEGIPPRQIEVVYNGVDADRFENSPKRLPLRARLDCSDQDQVIIQVATFRAVKDQAAAIKAFRLISPQYPRARLVLVGDGANLPACRKLAEELELDRSVRFLGPRDDIPELLAAADIMLMTSLSEAHSVSLLEGMAAGLPVVATEVGGNPETVVHGHTGLLAPARDVEAIAAALAQLLRQPRLGRQMGQAGRERVCRHFRRTEMHRRYLEIYHDLARRN